jgi:hypothetical protein
MGNTAHSILFFSGKAQDMPSLLNCSVELLANIAGLVPPPSRPLLMLVNRRLRLLTEQLIYSEIDLIWPFDEMTYHVQLLLRSVMNRPELGRYVRSLYLDGYVPYTLEKIKMAPKFEAGSRTDVEFVERMNAPFSQLWVQGLRAGTMDALLALLLLHLDRLETLFISPSVTMELQLTGLMLRWVLCEPAEATCRSSFVSRK